jgi:flagellar biogenesis protein FliO
MVQQALSVLLVFGLLGATLWWLRSKGFARFGVNSPLAGRRRSMKVIERLALTPQHSLHLVKIAERVMLVTASPAGCTIVENIPELVDERLARR